MTQATLYSAATLDSKVLDSLSKKLGYKLDLKLDPTLIAGIRLVVGTTVTEISLRDMLTRIEQSI